MRVAEPPRVHFSTAISLVFAFGVIGGIALVLGGFHTIDGDQQFRHDSQALNSYGVKTTGKVATVSSTAGDGMYPGSTSVRVRFTDQAGRSVVASASFLGQPTVQVGSSIGIIYDAKNPALIDLVDHPSYPKSTNEDDTTNIGIALIVLGGLICLISIVLPFLRLGRAPSAWYSDPWEQAEWRFWNGRQWTADVSGVNAP